MFLSTLLYRRKHLLFNPVRVLPKRRYTQALLQLHLDETMRRIISLLVLVMFCSICWAQEKEWKTPGIEVGKKAPDFELKDQLDKPIKLTELLKRRPVAIVFHRSASW